MCVNAVSGFKKVNAFKLISLALANPSITSSSE